MRHPVVRGDMGWQEERSSKALGSNDLEEQYTNPRSSSANITTKEIILFQMTAGWLADSDNNATQSGWGLG